MRKTNDEEILQMIQEGKTQREVAKHFDVSPAAICKRVKRIMPPESLVNLTQKQQKFVLEVANGETNTNAALKAFECSSRESAKTIGIELMARDDIQTAVSELMQEEGLTRRYRVKKLKAHVDNVDPTVSLKALDQSWKLDGSYAAEKHINLDLNYADMQMNLKEIREERHRLERDMHLAGIDTDSLYEEDEFTEGIPS